MNVVLTQNPSMHALSEHNVEKQLKELWQHLEHEIREVGHEVQLFHDDTYWNQIASHIDPVHVEQLHHLAFNHLEFLHRLKEHLEDLWTHVSSEMSENHDLHTDLMHHLDTLHHEMNHMAISRPRVEFSPLPGRSQVPQSSLMPTLRQVPRRFDSPPVHARLAPSTSASSTRLFATGLRSRREAYSPTMPTVYEAATEPRARPPLYEAAPGQGGRLGE